MGDKKVKAPKEQEPVVGEGQDDGPERYVDLLTDDHLIICVDCGAVVVDGDVHDDFHTKIEQ